MVIYFEYRIMSIQMDVNKNRKTDMDDVFLLQRRVSLTLMRNTWEALALVSGHRGG